MTLDISTDYEDRPDAIVALFGATFTASEGAEEGALIGDLARRLLAEAPARDLRVCTAWEDGTIVGGLFLTRLAYADDPRTVFLLAPVAVATGRQGEGIGQRLIARGLDGLRHEGVDVTLTYGDPDFYRRSGFKSITEELVPSPFPLEHPQGWLGQSLTDAPLTRLKGPVRCVEAFNDPVYW